VSGPYGGGTRRVLLVREGGGELTAWSPRAQVHGVFEAVNSATYTAWFATGGEGGDSQVNELVFDEYRLLMVPLSLPSAPPARPLLSVQLSALHTGESVFSSTAPAPRALSGGFRPRWRSRACLASTLPRSRRATAICRPRSALLLCQRLCSDNLDTL